MVTRQHIILGLIINSDQKICLAERDFPQTMGGQWEIPGGKVEVGETAYQALCREMKEELGIEVTSARAWQVFNQDYSDRQLQLDCWLVDYYAGQLYGSEGQVIEWVPLNVVAQYHMPPGNRDIIQCLLGQ